MEKEELKEVLTAILDARARVPEDEHREDHDWVGAQRAKDKRRAEFCAAVKLDLAKYWVKGTIAIVIAAVWWSVNQYLKTH